MLTGYAVLRDVRERGRDIEGCIKQVRTQQKPHTHLQTADSFPLQWFAFVKPNFHKYVEPQREVAGKRSHFFVFATHSHDDSKQCIVQLNFIEDKLTSRLSLLSDQHIHHHITYDATLRTSSDLASQTSSYREALKTQ
jgi:uridine kinase